MSNKEIEPVAGDGALDDYTIRWTLVRIEAMLAELRRHVIRLRELADRECEEEGPFSDSREVVRVPRDEWSDIENRLTELEAMRQKAIGAEEALAKAEKAAVARLDRWGKWVKVIVPLLMLTGGAIAFLVTHLFAKH